MSGKKMYSTELKLEIVQRYLEGNIGLKALAEQYHINKCDIQKWKAAYAAHFNVPSMKSVSDWERIYYEEGKEALYEERRGRTRKIRAKNPRKKQKAILENEDLLAEVQRLRMENEYLKKLNALVLKLEKSENKTK